MKHHHFLQPYAHYFIYIYNYQVRTITIKKILMLKLHLKKKKRKPIYTKKNYIYICNLIKSWLAETMSWCQQWWRYLMGWSDQYICQQSFFSCWCLFSSLNYFEKKEKRKKIALIPYSVNLKDGSCEIEK